MSVVIPYFDPPVIALLRNKRTTFVSDIEGLGRFDSPAVPNVRLSVREQSRIAGYLDLIGRLSRSPARILQTPRKQRCRIINPQWFDQRVTFQSDRLAGESVVSRGLKAAQ